MRKDVTTATQSRKKLDPQKLKQYLDRKDTIKAHRQMEYITEACDAAMPRIKPASAIINLNTGVQQRYPN